ncbi:antichymotrypsin-2-like [Haliotis rubra]|uniref:antichymotrypsin-2-like n=1 Tax=Haliotis rubra TaxID=36100 RepID=UPI001EE547A3|nr:antichymotrypsin-2-like [Haliotis rubra]
MDRRQTLALFLLCGILLLCDVHCKPSRRVTGEALQPFLARACNRVSLGVYEEVATSNNNVVFSPLSLCTLLAVCVRSASDKTLNELRKSLFLELVDKREMLSVYGAVYRGFVDDPNVNISTTNIMFVNKNFQLVDKAAEDYQQTFNGTFKEFDPQRKSEVSTSINNMVSSATNGMLKGKLTADDITSDQALYLFNTLFMSARWKDQFASRETRQQKFYLNSTTHVMVPTMHRRGYYRWNSNKKLGFEILELPYEGNRFAMYIILPLEKDGLSKLEETLTPERTLRLEKAITKMKKAARREVYLPKFSMTQSFSMKSALQKFGIKRLFDEQRADLSGLIKGGNVHVNEAFHDSAIDVTERGTVAGTYSKMGFYYLSAIPVFNVNRPFMYVLRDTTTGFNVFMGRCIRP